jgi:hypothetical protein
MPPPQAAEHSDQGVMTQSPGHGRSLHGITFVKSGGQGVYPNAAGVMTVRAMFTVPAPHDWEHEDVLVHGDMTHSLGAGDDDIHFESNSLFVLESVLLLVVLSILVLLLVVLSVLLLLLLVVLSVLVLFKNMAIVSLPPYSLENTSPRPKISTRYLSTCALSSVVIDEYPDADIPLMLL